MAETMMGTQYVGMLALFIIANGKIRITPTSVHKKLKSQGFEMECLLVSLLMTIMSPEVIAAVQAKNIYDISQMLFNM